ncbi:Heterokaryon incompatibility protein 6 [Colletotrichum gloeosporioides]|uniref:Heterokaryon incompatibility protein 6 n=1 Tax=Colletotrichum gloeosporioides TaxID=474922 RepID=A0A8H4C5R7_COLGL|nr:Heterokaryon incompatibility protein 6 [Colletotrichum gloeosporioides]KAF3797682.1 Heterokaryon incompatibility protein 6 [Colletotrichum gloeosporioides]
MISCRNGRAEETQPSARAHGQRRVVRSEICEDPEWILRPRSESDVSWRCHLCLVRREDAFLSPALGEEELPACWAVLRAWDYERGDH